MSTQPSYKATDQKWTVWDAPDEPFHADKEFLRFAIELPKYKDGITATTAFIRPSLNFSDGTASKFTCVYEMEYEVTWEDAPLSSSLLSDLIINDCYPAFVKAFDEQKLEFETVKNLKTPPIDTEIKNTIREGASKALLDSGFPSSSH